MRKLLLERAGLTEEMVKRGKVDVKFLGILDVLGNIHTGKQVLYGNYLETHGSDPVKFCLMEHYSDVKRKFVRAENFLKHIMNGEDIPMEELLDTYSDIAVYGALGVQLLLHLMEKKNAAGTPNKKPQE